MNQNIESFIRGRRIAAVGASTNPQKFGHRAFVELVGRGYEMIPVHPSAREIAGIPCTENLRMISKGVDGVLVMVPPKKALDVLRDAAEAGMKNVWLQQGTESAEVLALAGELGLNIISRKCILMYAPPVAGFHKFHRIVTGLVGRL